MENKIIHNEKLCKPASYSQEQIDFMKKQSEEAAKKQQLENELNSSKRTEIKLGDMVEKIAQPIAKAIDAIAGTDIQNCDACKKRKEKLNNIKI